MSGHATVPERDLDPGFGDSQLADVPNRPVDPILANLLADQGPLKPLGESPTAMLGWRCLSAAILPPLVSSEISYAPAAEFAGSA